MDEAATAIQSRPSGDPLAIIAGRFAPIYLPQLRRFAASAIARKRFSVCKRSTCIDILDRANCTGIRISLENAVYLIDMMNHFEYYFESAAPVSIQIQGHLFSIVDFSTPRFQKVAGFEDFPVMCPSLTEPFVTTQQYMEFADLAEGHVAVDLGCYSGLTSIAFSKAVGASGRVIAVEADPANLASCETNIRQHERFSGLSNIDLVNQAISDTDGFLRFSSEGAMGSSAVSIVGASRGRVVDVPCMTLGSLAAANGLERVDFVKMDIEGSETSVIAAARAFFERYRPRIMIEPHIVNGELSDKPVTRLLESYGYECSVIRQFGVDLPLVTAAPKS